ncbi:hypothetical protein CA13_05920 [Planctomycetes bacterium CA13]|uniref:Uncharacterized protein n=1 Tax=Novipirellula herctigrandis TaxID=2527986 RepID=A0A5C5YVY8_9BACT|nr:hypothetical protein CA13_05920 [Planctomycetes bacterium CA13]
MSSRYGLICVAIVFNIARFLRVFDHHRSCSRIAYPNCQCSRTPSCDPLLIFSAFLPSLLVNVDHDGVSERGFGLRWIGDLRCRPSSLQP